jgi:hypothetical protein
VAQSLSRISWAGRLINSASGWRRETAAFSQAVIMLAMLLAGWLGEPQHSFDQRWPAAMAPPCRPHAAANVQRHAPSCGAAVVLHVPSLRH